MEQSVSVGGRAKGAHKVFGEGGIKLLLFARTSYDRVPLDPVWELKNNYPASGSILRSSKNVCSRSVVSSGHHDREIPSAHESPQA
eukprot:scaffold125345_cov14-Tisochrysis_lutea.AAC.1